MDKKYWNIVKLKVLERDKHICQVCCMYGNITHHKTYLNQGNELEHLEDLICVCAKCHFKIHYIHSTLSLNEIETLYHKSDILTLKQKCYQLTPKEIEDIKIMKREKKRYRTLTQL